MKKRVFNFIVFSIILCSLRRVAYAEESAASTTNTKPQNKSLTMEEAKVEGVVEKPEFINVIQRRRLEFQDKGELNVSFKDKILQPITKDKLEDSFYEDIGRILESGSISSD